MRRVILGLAAVAGLVLSAEAAVARVAIRVDLSSQTMSVSSAEGNYVWPISSARSGYSTPRGTFGVQRMEAMHRSHKYHNAPMPHSLFFTGGYAIHGTYEVAALGVPASHGCIRLAPSHAAALYQMVRAEGGSISISGSAPARVRYARQDDGADRPMSRGRAGYAYDYGYAPQTYDPYGADRRLAVPQAESQDFFLGMGDYYGD